MRIVAQLAMASLLLLQWGCGGQPVERAEEPMNAYREPSPAWQCTEPVNGLRSCRAPGLATDPAGATVAPAMGEPPS